MKKILIVSTVSRQFYLFEQGNIKVLKSLGYEIHAAANYEDANMRLDELDIIRHPFDIQRSPFTLKNITAYRQLINIMKSENFDMIHCHSPMGGVLARLAAKSLGISKVIYTAHGFHFFRKAPIINWLIYFPVEKFLSRYTKTLITINNEDYMIANKYLKSERIMKVNGIGIDLHRFEKKTIESQLKRENLNIADDAFVILSVGELNKNKNHEIVLRAISILNNPKIQYIICGQGALDSYLKDLSKKLRIENQVRLLGFRSDIIEIFRIADVFVFPSKREGLSVSLLEAMASKLPIICSSIRGNIDLIENEKGGFLIETGSAEEYAEKIKTLFINESLREKMSKYNSTRVVQYSQKNVNQMMKSIYSDL